MDIHDKPLYAIGDFVACDYANILIFDYSYEDEINNMYYYGIVVHVDNGYYEYMEEYVYEILCLDGQKRYFMESELILV